MAHGVPSGSLAPFPKGQCWRQGFISFFYRGLVESERDGNLGKLWDLTNASLPTSFGVLSGQDFWIITRNPWPGSATVESYPFRIDRLYRHSSKILSPSYPRCGRSRKAVLHTFVQSRYYRNYGTTRNTFCNI